MVFCECYETLKNTTLKNICERLLLILRTRTEITQAKKVIKSRDSQSMDFQFRKLAWLQKNCTQI